MTATSEVLNRAADEIQRRGWTRGYSGWKADSPAGVCLEGALGAALGLGNVTTDYQQYLAFQACPAYMAVWNFLKTDSRWGLTRTALYDWNDAYGRTAAEVVEVLRATALIEAAREREASDVCR